MLILPAIDLRGGALHRATPDDDPVALAHTWATVAHWLHVADLDRAFGTGENDELVQAVLATAGTASVQLGGALTAGTDVARALAWGAHRVVLGADARAIDAMVATHGAHRLAIALDWARGRIVPPGRDALGESVGDIVARVRDAGVRVFVWRDRERDGTLVGAALEEPRALMAADTEVLYAGGVAGLDDLVRARAAGFTGVIVGRALLERRFTLEEALACSA